MLNHFSGREQTSVWSSEQTRTHTHTRIHGSFRDPKTCVFQKGVLRINKELVGLHRRAQNKLPISLRSTTRAMMKWNW